jgi:hypothetical protein
LPRTNNCCPIFVYLAPKAEVVPAATKDIDATFEEVQALNFQTECYTGTMSNMSKLSRVGNWKRSTEMAGMESSSDADKFDCISEVLGVEDLAFHITTYLVPERNPSTLQELVNNLIFISRHWSKVFSLVRAQLRWDYFTNQLSMCDPQWLYHKIVYIPGDCSVNSRPLPIPREGCLRIFRSHINEASKEAMNDYRSNRQNDEYGNIQRIDSRPDYYHKAYQERPICIELVPPVMQKKEANDRNNTSLFPTPSASHHW